MQPTLESTTSSGVRIPKVSIGMPVYNGESFIRKALDSLLTQTFTNRICRSRTPLTLVMVPCLVYIGIVYRGIGGRGRHVINTNHPKVI